MFRRQLRGLHPGIGSMAAILVLAGLATLFVIGPAISSSKQVTSQLITGSASAGAPLLPGEEATTFAGAELVLATVRVSDDPLDPDYPCPNCDGDGVPDDGETVRLDVTLVNRTLDAGGRPVDLRDVIITLSSTDPDVDCIPDGSAAYGTLTFGLAQANPTSDSFHFTVGNTGRTSPSQLIQAELSLGISARYYDSDSLEYTVSFLTTPRSIELHLDLDEVLGAIPVASDAACVGGDNAGLACTGVCAGGSRDTAACTTLDGDAATGCPGGTCDFSLSSDCPGTQGDGVTSAICATLPPYLRSTGAGAQAGSFGYFEGFEGAEHMGGRDFYSGPTPVEVPGTSFVHAPALSFWGGVLDGGWLDYDGYPLTPGATPGNSADDPEGSSAVDGCRCQYSDPRGPSPSTRTEEQCRPWDGSDWHANSWKAYGGTKSLYAGISGTDELGLDVNWDTYHTNALHAAFSAPLHIGLAGGATISIYHMIQTADDRFFDVAAGEALDRGYLEVAAVDPATGIPVEPWKKVNAFQNDYGHVAAAPQEVFIYDRVYEPCLFDPYDNEYDAYEVLGGTPGFDVGRTNNAGVPFNADLVSSEDDYFDPNDPLRQFGPSSGCWPERVYSSIGDFTSTDPADSGTADTPGETGSQGTGIWVNSRFSLDEFGGRTVRVRFVLTGLDAVPTLSWFDIYGVNFSLTGNALRGWRIDDVAVSGLMDSHMVFTVDTRTPDPTDCGCTPATWYEDRDGDGHGDSTVTVQDCAPVTGYVGVGGDCNDDDPDTYPGAPEVNDGRTNQCPDDPGYDAVDEVTGATGFSNPANGNEYCWPAQPGATLYQVVRSGSPDFAGGCDFTVTASTCMVDTDDPAPGQVFYYRVRAVAPFPGSWGEDPGGGPLTLACGTEWACNDGLDNDGDTLPDCHDPECTGVAGCGYGVDISSDTHVTWGLAVHDIDGDGDPDLIAANSGGISSNEINRFYLNNGTPDPWNGVTGADIGTDVQSSFSPHLVDVDGDGFEDLLVGNATSQANRFYRHDHSEDPWSSVSGVNITDDTHSTFAIAVADVNGDGHPDVVAGNYGFNSYYLHNGTSNPWDGVVGKALDADLIQSRDLDLADVDGDGDLDVVTADLGVPNRFYRNNGSADPWNGVTAISIGTETDDTHEVALADLDGDGDLDLIAVNSGQPNRMYPSNGTADPWSGVSPVNISEAADTSYAVAVGDVNGDGHPDLVIGNGLAPNLLYVNNGTSTPWAGVTGIPITADAHYTAVLHLADMDQDGQLDLIVGNIGEPNRYYRSVGAYITP